MGLSVYELSVPVLTRTLKNLVRILEKGETHAEAQSFDPAVLFTARLYPDMYPLAKQVQIATELAARGGARLAGEAPPSLEDKEQDFAGLKARIENTVARLEAIEPGRMEGAEQRRVTLQAGGQSYELSGQDYLMGFLLPNIYFHVTTAYDILRHNGVPLGKMDYMGVRPRAET